MACRAIDTPYVSIKDERGLVAEAKVAQSLGFKGKYVIHPDQVAPVNAVFAPTKDDVEYARRVRGRRGCGETAARVRRPRRQDDRCADRRASSRLIALAERIAERSSRRPCRRAHAHDDR